MTEVGLYVDSDEVGYGITMADGGRLTILDPDPAVIRPTVIAHSLSNLCRWTGHVRTFYSVAQHCVLVSQIVPPELALQGLLHDASEAFIGDVSRPLKVLLDELAPGVLRGIEERLHEAVADAFDSGYPHHPLVKEADNLALATECRDILPPPDDPRFGLPDPLPERIHALGPDEARRLWLDRFEELGGQLW